MLQQVRDDDSLLLLLLVVVVVVIEVTAAGLRLTGGCSYVDNDWQVGLAHV